MESHLHQGRPELPEGVEPGPRWPAWYAAVAFLVGLAGTFVAVGVVAAITGTTSGEESPTFTIVATVIQSAVFIATAIVFAARRETPKPWHFGLRPTRLWHALRWGVLGIFSFYLLSGVYTVIVDPDTEQTITQSLGANQGTVGLIAAGLMVIVVAPAAEEFFFRGFFYRALRSRFAVVPAAAIDGAVFGVIHYDFSGSDALLLIPPLAALGFIFCIVYERTGSLFPVIALHAFNNAIAYAVQADGGAVSAVLAPLMIGACVLVPRLLGSAPRAVPALR
jgi:CAAX protease family protein